MASWTPVGMRYHHKQNPRFTRFDDIEFEDLSRRYDCQFFAG